MADRCDLTPGPQVVINLLPSAMMLDSHEITVSPKSVLRGMFLGADGLKQNGTALADDGTHGRPFVCLDHFSVVYHTQSSRFDSENCKTNKKFQCA